MFLWEDGEPSRNSVARNTDRVTGKQPLTETQLKCGTSSIYLKLQ